MQTIKQFYFYSLIIFIIVSISCAGSEHLFERAGKELGKELGKSIVVAAPILGSDGAQKIGSEAVGKLAPYAGAAVGIYAAKEVVSLGFDIYKYNNPDEKEIALREVAKETIAAIRTKRGFRECLMNNAKGPRNQSNLPAACEACGINFTMAAGPAEFDNMVLAFKKAYQD